MQHKCLCGRTVSLYTFEQSPGGSCGLLLSACRQAACILVEPVEPYRSMLSAYGYMACLQSLTHVDLQDVG